MIALLLAACAVAPVEAAAPPLSVEGVAICEIGGDLIVSEEASATVDGDLWVIVAEGRTIYAPLSACVLEVQ